MRYIILCFMCAVTFLNAEDINKTTNTGERFYAGISLNQGSGELLQTLGTGYVWTSTGTRDRLQNFDSSSTPIKFGIKYKTGNRLEVSYGSIDLKYASETESMTGIDVDALLFLSNFITQDIKPYVLIGIGSYSYDDTAQYFTSNEDLGGFAFNYGVGFVYELDKKIELEIGIRGKKVMFQQILLTSQNTTMDSEITMTSASVGINYHF